jgi:hypothetical protein
MTERNKVTSEKFPAGRGPGRPKGSVNKTTALLKDAILMAATKAGNKEGLVGYLTAQAKENPGPFMSLLGKVLPMQVTGEDGGGIVIQVVRFADEDHSAG